MPGYQGLAVYARSLCLAHVFPQELQGPGYSSASAWGRRQRMAPPSQLRSAAPASSCAPRVSTCFTGNCDRTGTLLRLKITWNL